MGILENARMFGIVHNPDFTEVTHIVAAPPLLGKWKTFTSLRLDPTDLCRCGHVSKYVY